MLEPNLPERPSKIRRLGKLIMDLVCVFNPIVDAVRKIWIWIKDEWNGMEGGMKKGWHLFSFLVILIAGASFFAAWKLYPVLERQNLRPVPPKQNSAAKPLPDQTIARPEPPPTNIVAPQPIIYKTDPTISDALMLIATNFNSPIDFNARTQIVMSVTKIQTADLQTNNIKDLAKIYDEQDKEADAVSIIKTHEELLSAIHEFTNHFVFIGRSLIILTNLCGQLANATGDSFSLDLSTMKFPQTPSDNEIDIAEIKFQKHTGWNLQIRWSRNYSNLRIYGGFSAIEPPPSIGNASDFNYLSTNKDATTAQREAEIENDLKRPIAKIYSQFVKTNQSTQ